MEAEVSLPRPQVFTNCTYPEPDESIPRSPNRFLFNILFSVTFDFYAYVFQVFSSLNN